MQTERPDTKYRFPCLIGDVGGTNARFAIETAAGRFEAAAVLQNRDFPDFESALRHYLQRSESRAAGSTSAQSAAIAIANPLDGDKVKMTNSGWAFSIEAVRKTFGFRILRFFNDFSALAMAIPFMPPQALIQCGGDVPYKDKSSGLIGPGTGLGVSGLVPWGEHFIPLEAEGGHVSFSPFDELEMEIFALAKKRYDHVSAERLISGPGMEWLYRLLAEIGGETAELLTAPEITEMALKQPGSLSDRTVEVFCRMLGTVAGNLALTLGARGGIYIGGGIVPRIVKRFEQSGFRERFEAKGRFSEYVSRIPVFVLMDTFAAFKGVSAMMERCFQTEPFI